MFIVITGLDGSGTSTIANILHQLDEGSTLVRTPSVEYSSGRDYIDDDVRKTSQMAHYLYYLSSVVYMSDKIRKNYDYKNNNVYCVRYLIDTVVSHTVAGHDVELDYEKYEILKPDLTIYIKLKEEIRQKRIEERGKSQLDKLLDDSKTRDSFNEMFSKFLDVNSTVYFDNSSSNIEENVTDLFQKIKRRKTL